VAGSGLPGGTQLTLRFLALGDSYTIGEGVQPSQRWPHQLAALLRDCGVPIADPLIIARTGWTTDELSRAIEAANPSGTYQLVTLLIGVNNQYRGRDVEEYRKEFAALLRRAVGFAGRTPGRVVVLSIPDWGVTPFAAKRYRRSIAAAIDRFNQVNREEASKAGVHYVDITPASRTAASRPSMNAADGLHPSGEMYAEWARLTLPVARTILKPTAQR
jgi:lysophospholipase L1-like esterase